MLTLNEQAELNKKREELQTQLEQLESDKTNKEASLDAVLEEAAVQVMKEKLAQNDIEVQWEGAMIVGSVQDLSDIKEFAYLLRHVGQAFFTEYRPKGLREGRVDFIKAFGSEQQVGSFQELLAEHNEAEEAVKSCKAGIDEINRDLPLFDLMKKSGIEKPSDETMVAGALDFINGLMQLDRVSVGSVKVVEPEVVFVLTTRSQWAGSSGIARFSQVHVYFHGQSEMEEWQYRDQFSADRDNYRHNIHAVGEVQVSKENDKINLRVELINGEEYQNLQHAFLLELPEEGTVFETLPEEQLEQFRQQIESERERMLALLEESYEHKPEMYEDYPDGAVLPMGTSLYRPYRRPVVRQAMVQATGVAAFVCEEQIDHRHEDPQMRYELYVIKHGDEKARRIIEDHAYEKRESGTAFISVITLNPDVVVVNTSDGKSTIAIN